MTEDLLNRGIAALKAGRKAEARGLLAQLVEQEPRHELGWLWLSGAVDTDEDRRVCLENVLAINPNNDLAQRGLETLQRSSPPGPAGATDAGWHRPAEGDDGGADEEIAGLLQQAVAAIKSGDKERGRQLLIEVIEREEDNEAAWLWMCRCVTDRDVKRECFERVLAINPDNKNAIEGLKRLDVLAKADALPPRRSDPSPAKRAQFPAWLWGLIPVAGLLLIGGLGLLVSSLLATARPIAQMTLTPTPQPSPTRPPDVPPADASLGDTWTRPADGMVMVYVPAGEFQMGSTEAQFQGAVEQCVDDGVERETCKGWFADEKPAHIVSMNGFWIDKHEVTNAQFAAFLNEEGNQEEGGATWLDLDSVFCLIEQSGGEFRPKPGYADHPVVMVSWYGAKVYAEWVGGRLPSEAEWEYAARGPEGRIYPWGDEFDGTRLNFCDVNCPYDWRATGYDDGYEIIAPVGSFPDGSSWCGALDMAGNVWEWTRSLYKDYPYDSGDGREYLDAGNDVPRVVRGGSFGNADYSARCAYRGRDNPGYRVAYLGFRLVASPFISEL